MTPLKDKTANWLREIELYNQHHFRLELPKAALLIIDMQNFFVHENGPARIPGVQDIIPNLQVLQRAFRIRKRPVIFTSHVHKAPEFDGGCLTWWWSVNCEEGTFDAEIFEAIKPLPAEKLIHKHRYSAFEGTDLEINLRCLGIRELVITGVMTNLCCETTARDAFNRDYRVQFVCDATATAYEDLHLATLKNIAYGFAPVVTTEELLRQMG